MLIRFRTGYKSLRGRPIHALPRQAAMQVMMALNRGGGEQLAHQLGLTMAMKGPFSDEGQRSRAYQAHMILSTKKT